MMTPAHTHTIAASNLIRWISTIYLHSEGFEKLIVAQLVVKVPMFYGTHIFTSPHH